MGAIADAKRIVIKVGSSTLTYRTGNINIRRIELLCKTLADLKNSGREIIFVSSGAIAAGMGKLRLSGRPCDTPGKQAAAAVGQSELMSMYDRYFLEHHHTAAQMLITRDVVDQPILKHNVSNTLFRLLEWGAIPIINENDTVATEELDYALGDNDTLSAIVAQLAQADALIILSDIDGLYTDNPRVNKDARLIGHVGAITPEIEALAGEAGSALGTGGMITKIHAARIVQAAGINMAIINGDDPRLLYRLLEGEPVGTQFIWE